MQLRFCLVLSLCALSACTTRPWSRQNLPNTRFSFAAIGDMPYTDQAEAKNFPALMDDLNQNRVDFVVHDGDIKSGGSPCTDVLFQKRAAQFEASMHPFFYVFGDNEWTDCGRNESDPRDPMERLETLRELFTQDSLSLGRKKLALERQSADPDFEAFRENIRWVYGNVFFIGLNVPGGNNNREHEEFKERNRANLAWLKASFERAETDGRRGVVVVWQANPRFDLKPDAPARTGYDDLMALLEQETVRFGKPVLLIHGDTHYFRIDKPMVNRQTGRRVESFTRLETFGDKDHHWVEVHVDQRTSGLFRFEPRVVSANTSRSSPGQSP